MKSRTLKLTYTLDNEPFETIAIFSADTEQMLTTQIGKHLSRYAVTKIQNITGDQDGTYTSTISKEKTEA